MLCSRAAPIPCIIHNVTKRANRFKSTTAIQNPFQILFMGGDEFSCLVFEQLAAAKGALLLVEFRFHFIELLDD